MKLRNKKTGEIGVLLSNPSKIDLCFVANDKGNYSYRTLAELNEEWQDYEEPKDIWWLDNEGNVNHATSEVDGNFAKNREIGNYFKTKEEAEKAVEKLKAWKRLKDKGIVIRKLRHNENGGDMYWSCPAKTGISDKQIWLDLDLLYGGEE